MATSLKERYKKEIAPALKKELGLSNDYQVPKIEKVVINVGLGIESKQVDVGVEELTQITGQKALVTKAKKSIAGFKIRENLAIGAKVTLRGERMYHFLAKLIGVVMPRIRDFRGLNPKGFDGRGNFNLGLKDQLVFPEINYDKVQQTRGMNITIVTSATTDMEARALLTQLGFPFKKAKEEKPASDSKEKVS